MPLNRAAVSALFGMLFLGGGLFACQGRGNPPVDETPRSTTAPVTSVEIEMGPSPTSAPTSKPDQSSPADADVTRVRAVLAVNGTWTFHVTVAHPDTGWEDYANGWDVVLPDGSVAKPDPSSPFTRLLLHPHEHEQPFTRSQGGIELPAEMSTVTVRAHDLVDGFGGKVVVVDLMVAAGPDFTVERE